MLLIHSMTDQSIFFYCHYDDVLDISQFIQRTKLPREIVNALQPFLSPNLFGEKVAKTSGGFVLAKTPENTASKHHSDFCDGIMQYNCKAYGSWKDLKRYARKLTKVINKWYRRNGIMNMNINDKVVRVINVFH